MRNQNMLANLMKEIIILRPNNKWGNVLFIYTLFIPENNKTPQLQLVKGFVLYPEPGSNRHALRHWCLRPTRLPIPPSGRLRMQRYDKKLKVESFRAGNVKIFSRVAWQCVPIHLMPSHGCTLQCQRQSRMP